MALIKCPECGRENVSDTAKACPGCGFPIHEHFNGEKNKITDENLSVPKDKTKSDLNCNTPSNNSINKKNIMLVIIAIAVIWPVWYFSTRCEYSGCNKHKSSSGNYCLYHEALRRSYSNYSSYSYDDRSESDMEISNVEVFSNSTSSYCTGTIKNNGDKSFKFVQVKGSFKDRNGNTIETGDTYAVGSEGLEPGESTSFKIYCTYNYKIVSCSVTIYDYD